MDRVYDPAMDVGNPIRLVAIEGSWLRISGVQCGLRCEYCITGVRKRKGLTWVSDKLQSAMQSLRLAPAAEEVEREILESVERFLLDPTTTEETEVTADDLLEFTGVLQLFALFARLDRTLHLVTPGLRLANRDFAKECAKYPVAFTLTLPSVSAEITDAIMGRDGAHALLMEAIGNLQELEIPLSINCTVTRQNIDGLAELVRFVHQDLCVERMTLACFCLEQVLLNVDPEAPRLFAPYAKWSEQLVAIAAQCEERSTAVSVIDVPPCQVEASVLASGRVNFDFAVHTDSPTPSRRLEECDGCPFDPRCCHLPANSREPR